jgi:hypothetical protein
MNLPRNKWTFAFFWIIFAVAVVVLVEVASNRIASVRDLTHLLAYAIVYAIPAAVLGVLVLGRLAEKLSVRKFPLAPVMAVGIVLIIPPCCLLAQALLIEIGLLTPQHFWLHYFHTLRAVTALAIVFGLGGMLCASLQARVQLIEKRLHEKEIAEERARKLAAEARLSSLESRIHPHFLFNTLNAIGSLIAVNPARAEGIVCRLATLLRASLDASNEPLISLRHELAMVESYIDIEQARFGDTLRASVEVSAELEEVKVPPMSVQVLVENAVRHGITPKAGGGEIWVTASAEDAKVRIEVSDSGSGFDLTVVPPGHGLDNLVERLNALFGDNTRLNAFKRDGHSVVEMVLPRV